MILVTLGTQDKQFYRLLDGIQKAIDEGYIKEKVIVQAGYSKDYKTNDMEIFDLISMDEMDKLMKKCRILITHGGVGSIISGLKYDKKVIAIARLKKYGEHTNDHQLQIIDNFSNAGYILKLENVDDIGKLIDEAKKFKPEKYISNQKNFSKLIANKIDSYLKG